MNKNKLRLLLFFSIIIWGLIFKRLPWSDEFHIYVGGCCGLSLYFLEKAFQQKFNTKSHKKEEITSEKENK